MKKIILLNGSPKGEIASSNVILDDFKKIENNKSSNSDECSIEYEKFHIMDLVKNKEKISIVKDSILTSDAAIIAFPLYVDCLPSIVIEFFYELQKMLIREVANGEDKNEKLKEINCKVYAIVNNGFPEGSQNRIACEIVENFCKRVNMQWGGAAGIGMGGMVSGIKDVPMKASIKKNYRNVLENILNSIESGESLKENIYTEFNFPKKMYLDIAAKGWYDSAKCNGISKERLYAKPYEIK